MIVLDTNVLSEVLRPSPSPAVLRWLAAQEPMEVYLTTITQAEVLLGIAAMPAGRWRTRLRDAIEKLLSDEFEGRILPFDEEAARTFATIVSNRIAPHARSRLHSALRIALRVGIYRLRHLDGCI